MQASVVISYYKNPANLELILMALNKQTALGQFEVIIGEDDNDPATVTFLEKIRPALKFPIQHLSQEDIGFRKTKMLNKAVRAARNELMIFLDGDCVPHKRFVHAYLVNWQEHNALFGRRVMLSERLTHSILLSKKLRKLNLFQTALTGGKQVEDGIYLPYNFNHLKKRVGILGCNWSIHKNDLEAINGFDEDYAMAGCGEDNDVEWRLTRLGYKLKSVKFKAIVYHLYHKQWYSLDEHVAPNHKMMAEKVAAGLSYCKNGLNKQE